MWFIGNEKLPTGRDVVNCKYLSYDLIVHGHDFEVHSQLSPCHCLKVWFHGSLNIAKAKLPSVISKLGPSFRILRNQEMDVSQVEFSVLISNFDGSRLVI